MARSTFRANNHYVPNFYLKQWTRDSKVMSYGGIVDHASVPLWKARSTSSVANLNHLYPEIIAGHDTDELAPNGFRASETIGLIGTAASQKPSDRFPLTNRFAFAVRIFQATACLVIRG